jgi:hypothetical protein
VGITEINSGTDKEFAVQLKALNDELEVLNLQADDLEELVAKNVETILENK